MPEHADVEASEETQGILEFALALRSTEGNAIHHLDSLESIQRYRRKADEIAAHVGAGRNLLDWGCLYGQMTYLLERRGLRVVPYDIALNRRPRTLCELVGRSPVYSEDLVTLPFPDGSFDAVLSSGTLEHVLDPDASLREIHRVLRAHGWLIVYNLPNRLSWIEFVGRFHGLAHERRYGLSEARCWIEEHGFEVLVARHDNVFPCILKGLPQILRGWLGFVVRLTAPLDPLASRVPIVSRFATNLTLIGRKAETSRP